MAVGLAAGATIFCPQHALKSEQSPDFVSATVDVKSFYNEGGRHQALAERA